MPDSRGAAKRGTLMGMTRAHVKADQSTTATVQMERSVRSAILRFDTALEAIKRQASVSAVHRARAMAHQLVDTLRTFDGLKVPTLKDHCGLIKDTLGQLRDLHVQGRRRGGALVRATQSTLASVREYERQRPTLRTELSQALHVERPDPARLMKRLHKRLRRLTKRIARLPSVPSPHAAHRLRVRIKRAHHAVAILTPTRRRLLEKLKASAEPLGKLHDLDAGLGSGGHTRRHWLARSFSVLRRLSRELAG